MSESAVPLRRRRKIPPHDEARPIIKKTRSLGPITCQKMQITRGFKKKAVPKESDTDTAPVEDKWWLGVPGMLLHCTFISYSCSGTSGL